MTPTWYDILGLGRDATPEQVKAAWRRATDAFEPGSGSSQFRMFNEAADVLLDPSRRAAYDAELDGLDAGPTEDDTLHEPVASPVTEATPAVVDAPEGTPRRRRRLRPARASEVAATPVAAETLADGTGSDEVREKPHRPAGLGLKILALGVLPLLAALAVAAAVVFGVRAHHDSQVAEARSEAPAAAERGMTALLAYDYRQMDADRNRAERYLTSSYRKSYLQTFKVLDEGKDGAVGPAEQTKTVVTADVLDTAVVDAEPDRVRVLVYVNQTAKKASGNPTIFQNRAAATMVKQGSTWLIDDVQSY